MEGSTSLKPLILICLSLLLGTAPNTVTRVALAQVPSTSLAPSPASTADCLSVALTLPDCLDYVEGNASRPSGACCKEVAPVIVNTPQCLCILFNKTLFTQLGLTINATLALNLPTACKLTAPNLSLCTLLGYDVPGVTSASPPTIAFSFPPPPTAFSFPPPPTAFSSPPPPKILPTGISSGSDARQPSGNLRQSSSPPPASSHTSLIAGIVVPVVTLMALAATGFILFLRFQRRKLTSGNNAPLTVSNAVPPYRPDQPLKSGLDSTGIERYINPSVHGPMRYTYQQLCEATHNFDASRFLGKGGCGPVYKGDMDEEFIAVKRVNGDSKQGFKEFYAEINIISDLRHRNLVRLRGWCYEDNKYFLVYEYIASGSLDAILFDDKRCRNELSWERRFSIVLGLGTAIQYLHEECNRVIIHRDIKTSNVLLDEKYVVKLGDFGLSRDARDSQTFTTVVAGTQGYMAPEVFTNRKSSKQSDVYSFGAVLAEIACGKRVIDGRGLALVDWVWSHLPAEALIEAADERLGGNFNEDEMVRVLLVSLACSHPDPSARPSIRQAMEILRGTAPLPDVPLYKPIPVYMSSPGNGFPTTSSSTSSYEYGTKSGTFISGR